MEKQKIKEGIRKRKSTTKRISKEDEIGIRSLERPVVWNFLKWK